MKIRNGFVSNSSSSSFLVAFPRYPKSLKDVQEMVFGEDTWFAHPYGDMKYYPEGYSAEQIAGLLWAEITKQIPNNKNLIFYKMHNVLVENLEEYESGRYTEDDWYFDSQRYEEDNRRAVIEFMDKHKGSYFYHFEFHDDSGEPGGCGCAMEHGDLFHRLPHLRSSNH